MKNARKFYLTYKDRIDETVFNLFAIEKSETVFSLFEEKPPFIVSWIIAVSKSVSEYLVFSSIPKNSNTVGCFTISSGFVIILPLYVKKIMMH